MSTVLAGFALGFAVAAGFGPISVLALTSGLRRGFAPAFGVGLGAALVDGLYALLAALGLAALIGPAHSELISRALLGSPGLVLFDEPSQGLAPKIVADVLATIARLRDEGVSSV